MDKLKFPILNDVNDYDKSNRGALEFNTYNLQQYTIFFVLPVVWLVLLLLHNKLSIMPVPKGNVESTLLFRILELLFSKLGFLWLILRPISILISIIVSSFMAFFFHASFVHVFGNIIVYIICVMLCLWFNLKVDVFFKQLISFSFFGIAIPWLSIYFIGFILSKIQITKNWLVVVSNSNIPIVGASVGLFGLLGLFVIITFMNLGRSRWNSLILIFLGVLTFALLGQQVLNYMDLSTHITLKAATNILVVVMHFMGYILGLIYGFSNRFRFIIK